jgi:hypothetical protein
MRPLPAFLAGLTVAVPLVLVAAQVGPLTTFANGTVADADAVNSNFSAIESAVNDNAANTVPAGAVLMWSGDPTSVPAGWALCDGSNGTPDLRGRFVAGYDPADGDHDAVGDVGGSHTHQHGLTGRTDTVANPAFGGGFIAFKETTGGSAGCDSTNNSNLVYRITGGSTGTDNGARVPNGSVVYDHNECAEYSGIHGNAVASDGRPPYYTLAYIMKL